MQNMSVSPDGKLLAVLGDSSDFIIADSQSGKVQNRCKFAPSFSRDVQ
jgi:WD40 repeat protein